MVGWWAKQRVGACIFDLLRVLERAAPVERAKILVMAHMTGYGMFRDPEIRAVIVADAVAQMREMGAKVGELYGDPGANFMADLDVDEAVRLCGYVPAFAR